MVNRLEQLFKKLDFKRENGLFYLSEADSWVNKFPYRTSKILKEILKPFAFFCLYHNSVDNNESPIYPINQPFILFFDNPNQEEESKLHIQLINFGLAQVVFINRGQTLDIFYGGEFEKGKLNLLKKNASDIDCGGFSFYRQLTGKAWELNHDKNKKIDRLLLNNITDARRILIAKNGLNLLPKAANRLIGRLLFISYLIDRDVVFSDQNWIQGKSKSERRQSFRSLIKNRKEIYQLFEYLNDKYNGDLFPLEEKDKNNIKIYVELNEVSDKHLEVLSHLFNSSSFFENGGKYGSSYAVQPSLFNLYDFEIIPVELISSIYENFIGNQQKKEDNSLTKRKEIKAYYTPTYLVDYVLTQTVSKFLNAKDKTDSSCKTLDPACGSGIFLVETLRKIIEKQLILNNSDGIGDDQLWKLVKDNIFGIDIDNDAIDIAIFSLYITILDYKQPKEIEHFKFQKLRNENLFEGLDADFFNTKHKFNTELKDIDFIIGNPPWGKIEKSKYLSYISLRNNNENANKRDKLPLAIADKEICQAFLVRVSDFSSQHKVPKCCFIVSSKVFYNDTGKVFRNYFLQRFHIKQILELSLVNNKIRGGA